MTALPINMDMYEYPQMHAYMRTIHILHTCYYMYTNSHTPIHKQKHSVHTVESISIWTEILGTTMNIGGTTLVTTLTNATDRVQSLELRLDTENVLIPALRK